MLGLGGDDLQELAQALLHCLDDVCFELREGVLHTDQVLAIVVLLLDLLVQAVVDTALEDVWVIGGLEVAGVRVEDCSVLAEELNVLLCMGAGLVNRLAALSGALCQFLALILNLGV